MVELIDMIKNELSTFIAENIVKINVETETCLEKIRQFLNKSKDVQQRPLSDLKVIVHPTRDLTRSESLKQKALELHERRVKIFEAAKIKLPELCTTETIIKSKVSYHTEIKNAIASKQLRVHQKYGEGKKAVFLLFLKEDVLNWVSKKWGI